MKIEKNKIVFSALLICTLLFIAGYAILVLGEDEEPSLENSSIPIPELKDNQKEYDSKLDALNDLKEVRQTNAPSIYNERLLDSTGVYEPDFLDKEKMRIVDSIYQQGRIQYSGKKYENTNSTSKVSKSTQELTQETATSIKEKEVAVKELGLEHQLFFTSHPIKNEDLNAEKTDAFIYVRVDGTQTVKNNYRLQMRLNKAATINGEHYYQNTILYGFVSFKPNRTIIDIERIKHNPIKLKAYDYQDGSEGVYIENSIRAEVTNEVLGDMVEDLNITGIPQLNGIKNVFRRNQRNVKTTILDNYNLILRISKQKNKFQFN